MARREVWRRSQHPLGEEDLDGIARYREEEHAHADRRGTGTARRALATSVSKREANEPCARSTAASWSLRRYRLRKSRLPRAIVGSSLHDLTTTLTG